jgi:hypothetical protein
MKLATVSSDQQKRRQYTSAEGQGARRLLDAELARLEGCLDAILHGICKIKDGAVSGREAWRDAVHREP